jgi:hypothetical protein
VATSHQAVAEYLRKRSDSRFVGGHRILVLLLVRGGLVAGVRVMRRRRRTVWKLWEPSDAFQGLAGSLYRSRISSKSSK